MAIAQPLTAGKQNAINVYDINFNILLGYEIKLTANDCTVYVVSVDSVSFCNGYATLLFELPCIAKVYYKLEIIETTGSSVLHTLSSKVY